MSGKNRENRGMEAPGPLDRALDRDRDDKADILEGGADRTATGGRQMTDRDAIAIPVAEERLNVEKRQAELGEVRVHKTVETEQVDVPVELRREEVHVEQRDIADRPATGQDLFREGTIRVPVRGEEAMVTKEAVVTGEVVLNKEQTTERQTISDTLRKERVEVDENYDRHRGDFQQHYTQRQSQYQGSGLGNRSWEDAENNYRYGYAMRGDEQYRGREFDEVEPDLRRDYESRYNTAGTGGGATGGGDAWQHLREEIREGWNRGRR